MISVDIKFVNGYVLKRVHTNFVPHMTECKVGYLRISAAVNAYELKPVQTAFVPNMTVLKGISNLLKHIN